MGVPGATYYVRGDGNDGNAGTGHTSGQAWKTIGKVIGELANNVTVYVAPGDYDETGSGWLDIANNGVSFIGDIDAVQFPDIGPGEVTVDRTAKTSLFRIDGSNILYEGIYGYDDTGPGPNEMLMIGSVTPVSAVKIRRVNMSNITGVWKERPPIFVEVYSGSSTVIVERCHANRGPGGYWDGMSVIVNSGASNVLVQNCFMVTGSTGGAVQALSGSDNVRVQNCTLILPAGEVDALVGAAGTNVTVRNTIMIINTADSNALCMDVDAAAIATFTSDYNLIKQVNASGELCKWGATSYTTLAAWQAATSQDANSIDSAPLFVNIGAGDVHLQFTSPCVDGGISTGAPIDDLDGNLRPQ